MEFFIKKIFDDNVDTLAHLQYQKYSRGEFKNKAMVNAKTNAKGETRISTI